MVKNWLKPIDNGFSLSIQQLRFLVVSLGRVGVLGVLMERRGKAKTLPARIG